MQLHGEWSDAIAEASRARDWMMRPSMQPGVGDAFYELAEIRRLRGEFAEAEAGYREGLELGRSPQPGLALMRLMQGQVEPAAAAVRRELDEAHERAARCRLLPASVEISIAAGDLDRATAGVDELVAISNALGVPYPRALAAHARGALLLASGNDLEALEALRSAAALWRGVDAPYEGARTSVLIGLACRRLGDTESAELELDAARKVFARLGADPDSRHVDELLHPAVDSPTGGLSAREVQVLRLVAAGKTNRKIAGELFISEKTVARHVSNIFTKLGLSSRAAATAYAYEHGLN
jgi:DNA-binding NarL/FixJ family response regulator